jgi:hypothetical protein
MLKNTRIRNTESNTAVVAGGKRGKDDRKQNTLAPLIWNLRYRNFFRFCGSASFIGDPDSTSHPDSDPDSDFLFDADPDLTFHPDADPIPDPSFKKKAQTLEKVLK